MQAELVREDVAAQDLPGERIPHSSQTPSKVFSREYMGLMILGIVFKTLGLLNCILAIFALALHVARYGDFESAIWIAYLFGAGLGSFAIGFSLLCLRDIALHTADSAIASKELLQAFRRGKS